MRSNRRVCLVASLLLLSGCLLPSDDDPTHYPEVARTPSPDGRLDAVLIEDGGNATTGVFHDVFVVPHGAPLPHTNWGRVAVLDDAMRNNSAMGVNLRWHGNDTLALEYTRAAHQRVFRPEVDSPIGSRLVGRLGRTTKGPVTVVLAPGVVDSTAPAGSMVRVRPR